MAESTLEGLITELLAAFRSLPQGVRALLGPSGVIPPVEEAKFTPAAAAVPERTGELPESYGRTRLVLLVVGAYRVHAYWEVTPEALARAQAFLDGAAEGARPVLRFFDEENRAPSGSFDIEVDLTARSCFVDLWSADRSYRTGLGLKSGDGRFAELARSNSIHTPRAWPKREIEERFLAVKPAARFARAAAAPAAPPAAGDYIGRRQADLIGSPPGELPEDRGRPVELPVIYAAPPPADTTAPFYPGQPAIYPEEPETDAPRFTISREPAPADLTAAAEEKFVPGVSSPEGQGDHGEE